jgi:hypothetical protein
MIKSNQTVSPTFWRILLISLLLVILIGVAFTLMLATGLADPPRGAYILLDQFPDGDARTPFTLELENTNHFRLTCASQILVFRVRDDGYFSVDTGSAEWRGFHHIERGANTLYLHVDAQNRAVFRINRETAWTGHAASSSCQWHVEV